MAFSVVLNINSVNLSAKIVASVPVVVTAKEGEARIATFTLNPNAGTIDPYDWIGQSVTIDYVDGTTKRIFTGIVHQPTYDVYTGLTSFICTDNLQEVVELISRASIDALITQGYWHDSVFSDPEENWTYAQQRMSTYPGSFDLSPSAVSRVTSWTAKVSPDFTYTDSAIIDKSLSLSLAERRSITNSIDVEFSSRFERLWQRELTASWTYVDDWYTPSVYGAWYRWLQNTFQLPTKDNCERAFNGWLIKSITYTEVPASGTYGGPPDGAIVWQNRDYDKLCCIGFDATIAARWKQSVTCKYTINVKSAASVTQHTELKITRQHSVSSPTDDEFTNFDVYAAPTGTLISTGNWVGTNEQSITTPMLCALNQAKVTILSSHRANRVSFQCVLNPDADVDKTIRVNHSKLQAKGKVSSITHEIDFERGSAISTVEIAVYLPNVSGQTNDTIAIPSSPYTNPTGLPSSVGALTTEVGAISTAPPEDPDWRGWICNHFTWVGTPEIYETKMQIEIPEVTEGEPVDFTTSSIVYNVAIPQDELVIIK